MGWDETRARILREAAELKPGKVAVTVLALPFFVLGLLLGAVWLVVTLAWQAGWVGVEQARGLLKKG